jgi:hypothetical protein
MREPPEGIKIAHNATPEQLRVLLQKHSQEAAVTITPENEIYFDYLEESKRNRIPQGQTGINSASINGFEVTFRESDKVVTPDNRIGTVLGSIWIENLTLYRYNNEPRIGYFLVKVDFEDHTELFLRNDLKGNRFRQL